MRFLFAILVFILTLSLATPATVTAAGEGRFQAIVIYRGSSPMVFILDTAHGYTWLWQKGSYTNEAGLEENWSTLYYQGRLAAGKDTGLGELISSSRWRLPDKQ